MPRYRRALRWIALAALAPACIAVGACGGGAGSMDTKIVAIENEPFDAELHLPAGPVREPAVLVLGGSDGGVPSRRAKALAEHGYAALALGYFQTPHTPEYLDMIPLEYFEAPIAWLIRHRHAERRGIAVSGESKGSELALLLASRKPEITGVVAAVPSSVVFQGIPKEFWPPRSSWSAGGAPVPFVPYDMTGVTDPTDVLAIYRASLAQQEAARDARIPVEKINGPILLFSAEDDRMWPSVDMSNAIVQTLREQGFRHAIEHVSYPDAGHTLTEYFMMGGTADGNRSARIDSLKRTVGFLGRIADE